MARQGAHMQAERGRQAALPVGHLHGRVGWHAGRRAGCPGPQGTRTCCVVSRTFRCSSCKPYRASHTRFSLYCTAGKERACERALRMRVCVCVCTHANFGWACWGGDGGGELMLATGAGSRAAGIACEHLRGPASSAQPARGTCSSSCAACSMPCCCASCASRCSKRSRSATMSSWCACLQRRGRMARRSKARRRGQRGRAALGGGGCWLEVAVRGGGVLTGQSGAGERHVPQQGWGGVKRDHVPRRLRDPVPAARQPLGACPLVLAQPPAPALTPL